MSSTRGVWFVVIAAALELSFTGETVGSYVCLTDATPPGPQGPAATDLMEGQPTGGGLVQGSTDTYTLAIGGEAELEFCLPAVDGPGTDIIVFENPFAVLGAGEWDTFVEVCHVEVSSNGIDWARFPNAYTGQQAPYISGGLQLGAPLVEYRGFAGVMPVFANPPDVDPVHVVEAGGDAFDLSVLLTDPLVKAGFVDLSDIRYLKLVDIQAGADVDSTGTPVWDCGFVDFAAADVDAAVAVNTQANSLPGRPEIEMWVDANGLLTIEIEDQTGLFDIKTALKASLNGVQVDFYDFLPLFVITQITTERAVLVTGPVPPTLDPFVFKLAARDGSGLVGGDAVHLP